MHRPQPTRSPRLACLTGAVLLFVPLIVGGSDRIEGQIDGDARSWHVLEFEGESTAASHEFSHGMIGVSIRGHQEPRFQVQGTISIDFTIMNGQALGGPLPAQGRPPALADGWAAFVACGRGLRLTPERRKAIQRCVPTRACSAARYNCRTDPGPTSSSRLHPSLPA